MECCPSHVPGSKGACCDPEDCEPCCGQCPTCPTTRRAYVAVSRPDGR